MGRKKKIENVLELMKEETLQERRSCNEKQEALNLRIYKLDILINRSKEDPTIKRIVDLLGEVRIGEHDRLLAQERILKKLLGLE